jgi:hypothetical protein
VKHNLTLSIRAEDSLVRAIEQYKRRAEISGNLSLTTSSATRRLIETQLVTEGLLKAVTPWKSKGPNSQLKQLTQEVAELKSKVAALTEKSNGKST